MINFLEDVDGLSFIIFYGSQLGQAKSIAEGLVDVALEEYSLITKAFELNVIRNVADLDKLTCPIVIVTSTTGDGEPPDNADKFWRKIRKKVLKSTTLESIKYTVLGLGDTNYNNFCNCGKEFHRRFQDLGATTFYPPAWADDAVGADKVIDNWIAELWPALENLIRPGSISGRKKDMEKSSLTLPSCPPVSLNLEWREEPSPAIENQDLINPPAPYPLIEGDPVEVTLSNARVLTKQGALKTTLELTLSFKEKPFQFEPGDAINIVCPNSEVEVEKLLERLDLTNYADNSFQLSLKEGSKGKRPVFLPATINLKDAFRYYLDIRSCPKKNFLRLLAEFTSDDNEKAQLLTICSKQGSAEFESKIRFAALSLLDLLLTYPSCKPPLEALLEHLPRLAPRAFSISSSPVANNQSFTFVFNVIVIPKENGRKYDRLGVCTGWLAQKAKTALEKNQCSKTLEIENLLSQMSDLKITGDVDKDTEIVIYRRKNPHFRLPSAEHDSSPIVMVGPGTGVAPFVGFVQHRAKLVEENKDKRFGNMTLYYGCRNQKLDFLYEDELLSLQQNENLPFANFHVVFSRDDPDAKVKYVQHRMEENKEELIQTLFDNEGYLYVCGDARNMAKDVRETLLRCIQSVKNVSEAEAKTLINELTTNKRYLQDIWT